MSPETVRGELIIKKTVITARLSIDEDDRHVIFRPGDRILKKGVEADDHGRMFMALQIIPSGTRASIRTVFFKQVR